MKIHVRVYYMGGRDHVSEVAHIIPGHRGIARRIAARLCSRHSAGRVGAPGSVGFQGAGCRVKGAGCRVQGSGCRVRGVATRVQNQCARPRLLLGPSVDTPSG